MLIHLLALRIGIEAASRLIDVGALRAQRFVKESTTLSAET
jgi:hypothetical protein